MFVGGGLGERIYWDFSEDNLPSGETSKWFDWRRWSGCSNHGAKMPSELEVWMGRLHFIIPW